MKRGPGRPKGTPNKVTALLKDQILAALDKAGGVKYLMRQAEENPVAFMGLVGKVLPTQVNHSGGVVLGEMTQEQRDACVAAFTRADT